ncbi:MAG: ABC transporter ATP-binding protein [Verrucomicrobiota bacterium]|nr:ABC transporter ATP-binding protein [Verrucomicrobiota bacterium]
MCRDYKSGDRIVHAVDEVSLEIRSGEFVAITGPSGCGKSTLMHLIAGLETPTSGEIYVDEVALHNGDDAALTNYRRHRLGIVFQFFNLLPTMNVLENVGFPLLLQGVSLGEIERRALALLDVVGMTERAGHFVHQLSGGEQQRTAIARALIHEPSLLIADEPTGNLDSKSAQMVLEVLTRIGHERRTTLLVVTHSEDVAAAAPQRVEMRDGRIARTRGIGEPRH